MNPKEKYKSATSFRMAVQDKLVEVSRRTGTDIQRLYKQVAFAQLLARLFKHSDVSWALKGGHALELRLQRSRATKDIDLALKDEKIFAGNAEDRNQALQNLLVEKSMIDLGDYFTFMISDAVMDLENAPYGGVRFHVEALIDQKSFAKFLIDIAIGDVWIEPQDEIELVDYLEGLGIKTPKIKVISIEQHISEKIHALTLPRKDRINSRAKDLVDLYLIFKEEKINQVLCRECLKKTFERRNTHMLPSVLPDPPKNWESKYKNLASKIDVSVSIEEAFEFVSNYFYKHLV